MLKIRAILLVCAIITTPCWAGYYDVLDTGEVLKPGNYKLTADAQLLTSTGGANVGAKIDAGFRDEFGMRALAGFGRTDYYFGGLFKWIPVPDIDNQPALGFNAGLLYAKWYDARDLTFRFEPLASKKFTMDSLVLTPYASLPMSLRTRSSSTKENTTDLGMQIVLGSQVQIEKWKNLQFMGEVGLDVDKAFSHISVAALWYFDENGFELK